MAWALLPASLTVIAIVHCLVAGCKEVEEQGSKEALEGHEKASGQERAFLVPVTVSIRKMKPS